MKAIPCNEGWFCRHYPTDEPPIPVRIPDDAMLREPRGARSSGGANVGWFDGRDYSYTRTLTLSEQDLFGALLLELEGVYRKAEVFVNGEKAGARPYGYLNFYVDLIPFAKIGENRIEVRAFNADQPNSRWYSGTGSYRPVVLWKAPKRHILPNGVKLKTLSLDPPTVEVAVQTTDPGAVTAELCDGETVLAAQKGEQRTFAGQSPFFASLIMPSE
ncbi:MAG: hypothetical protein IJK88_10285 [Clostridia bacterium]|nr:hypothetical protein [Clostridia bacterium]